MQLRAVSAKKHSVSGTARHDFRLKAGQIIQNPMADNSISESFDPLVQFLEDAADGAHDHGVAVGLKQNDEAALRTALTDLIGKPAGPGNVPPAELGFKDKWNVAKAAKTSSTGALRSAKSNGRVLARACIGVLQPRLGQSWNNTWQTAGFTHNSLAVPQNPLPLLNQLRSYFVTNPTHEVADLTPTISATATACEASAQAISTAASTSNNKNMESGQAKKNLAAGIKAARARLTGLREELDQLIEDDDDLWYAFGFDKPGDPDTPEVPENLVATPGAAGSKMLFVDWDDAVRGHGYRVIVTDTATPPVQLANEIVHESEANLTLDTLPSGTAVRITVSARNRTGGESGPSTPVNSTVP